MKTEVIKAGEPGAIEAAADIIRAGGLVAFPTETVYGLGADALNPQAVLEIFAVKKRPADNPLIVHISGTAMLGCLVTEVNEYAERLMRRFWPGPLTLIMKKSPTVPYETTAGHETVALRFPANETALALICAAGRPIAAPSANRSGRPSPTEARHVLEDHDGAIPMILDGGSSEHGIESTIVDVSGAIPVLLRPGSVTIEDIREVCGVLEIGRGVTEKLGEGEKPSSPGQKYRHYAPRAELIIVKGERGRVVNTINGLIQNTDKPCGVLASDETAACYCENAVVVSLGGAEDKAALAARLYSALRSFDETEVCVIYAEAVDEDGLGFSIMNRLEKAAGYKLIHA